MKQHKDHAIILRRIDYAERDRILTVLSAENGKISLLAKGVRSAKSRLAGGIELLSVAEVSFVEGKSSLMTLTSARLHSHFGNLVSDVRRMQQAFAHIKTVSTVIDDGAGQEYYPVLVTALACLNEDHYDRQLVDIWFNLQVLQLGGSAPNLHIVGDAMAFEFSYDNQQFIESDRGLFTRDDLKVLRLCLVSSRPPRLQSALSSGERIQTLVQAILKSNATEL